MSNLDYLFDLYFRDGALYWADGSEYIRPNHTSATVGAHKAGYNKTIGKTVDGKKKRFWLGHDKREAERKAVYLLNTWAIILQRDGAEAAAWDEKTLKATARGVHIDRMTTVDRALKAAVTTVAADTATLCV